MAYKILIYPLAHGDEYEAYTWYEKQRLGLGDELLKELQIAYKKISNNPEHYSFMTNESNCGIFSFIAFLISLFTQSIAMLLK